VVVEWNYIIIIIIIIIFVSLLGTSETFLCSTFALELKTVLLVDVLQLLMLSAGTLMSLEIVMFPLNTFYCKQDTVFNVTYLLDSLCTKIYFILFFYRSIILCTFVDI
jgi:hypothetical protein